MTRLQSLGAVNFYENGRAMTEETLVGPCDPQNPGPAAVRMMAIASTLGGTIKETAWNPAEQQILAVIQYPAQRMQ